MARWATRDWTERRWREHLVRAAERYPEQLDERTVTRCWSLHDEARDAHDALASGPRAWIHHDPHLDNVLWRPDGRPVLLDWSGAGVLPPALDVAMLAQSLSFADEPSLPVDDLLAEYGARVGDGGRDVDPADVAVSTAHAVRLLVRGLIGWAGSVSDEPVVGRMAALRDRAAVRASAALNWLDV